MGDRKTLDDYLLEGVFDEINAEMEKEASVKTEASTPAPEKTPESYDKMKKLAQQLRELADKADTPETVVRELKATVKSVESE